MQAIVNTRKRNKQRERQHESATAPVKNKHDQRCSKAVGDVRRRYAGTASTTPENVNIGELNGRWRGLPGFFKEIILFKKSDVRVSPKLFFILLIKSH